MSDSDAPLTPVAYWPYNRVMETLPNNSEYAKESLKDWHREAIRLLTSGARTGQVARLLGRSRSSVTRIRHSQAGRAYFERLRRMLEEAMTTGIVLRACGTRPFKNCR